jgi:hypothetical protein
MERPGDYIRLDLALYPVKVISRQSVGLPPFAFHNQQKPQYRLVPKLLVALLELVAIPLKLRKVLPTLGLLTAMPETRIACANHYKDLEVLNIVLVSFFNHLICSPSNSLLLPPVL